MGDEEPGNRIEPERKRDDEQEPDGNRIPDSELIRERPRVREPEQEQEQEGEGEEELDADGNRVRKRHHNPHGSQFIGVRLNLKARMRLNELSTKWSCSRSEVIRRLLLTAPDESPCEPTSPKSPTTPSPIELPPPPNKR
jgi:hypothetical protein